MRLYKIASDDLYFRTGHLQDGTQVLMGLQRPELVLVEFDTDGNYQKTETKAYNNKDEQIEFQGWQDEIGLVPGGIVIKTFFLSERSIGIRDLPEHYQAVLDHPKDYKDDEDERQELLKDIKEWQEQGDFVLVWDEDYYFNKNGELESS
jgi:hypothetical protein